jgi:uroporphyrin-III C-methyltransferase
MPESLDWKSLARGSPVLVIYMGLKHLTKIAARLIEVGRDSNEPVAIISKATLPEQKVLETTLADCAKDIVRDGVQPPTVIVIGQVVNLRSELKWPVHPE